MATIYDLVNQYEAEVAREETREARVRREIDTILNGVKASGRRNLTADEDAHTETLFAEVDRAREARDSAKAKLSNARRVQEDEDRLQARSREVRPTAAALPRGTATVSVTRNERTYNPQRDSETASPDKPGSAFLLDVGRAYLGDVTSLERLQRHQREELVERPWLQERASTTSNFAGLVVPRMLPKWWLPPWRQSGRLLTLFANSIYCPIAA